MHCVCARSLVRCVFPLRHSHEPPALTHSLIRRSVWLLTMCRRLLSARGTTLAAVSLAVGATLAHVLLVSVHKQRPSETQDSSGRPHERTKRTARNWPSRRRAGLLGSAAEHGSLGFALCGRARAGTRAGAVRLWHPPWLAALVARRGERQRVPARPLAWPPCLLLSCAVRSIGERAKLCRRRACARRAGDRTWCRAARTLPAHHALVLRACLRLGASARPRRSR